MLQGLVGEGIFDFELGLVAVRPLGVDEEAAVAAGEGRDDAVMVEPAIVEIAAHRLLVGQDHGLCMVGFRKSRGLIGVAGCARSFVHETLMDRYLRVGRGYRDIVSGKAAPGEREQQEKQDRYSSHCC